MKKIAIIHPSFLNKGGAENVVIWLADSLSKKNYDVVIYTSDFDESFFGKKSEKKYQIKELKVKGHKFNILSFLYWVKAGFKLRKELQGFDIINPHNFPSYIWLYYAKIFNKKLRKVRTIWYCEEPFRAFYYEITDKNCIEAKKIRVKEMFDDIDISFKKNIIIKIRKWKLLFPFKVIINKTNLFFTKVTIYFAEKIDRKVVSKIKTILTNSKFIADNMLKIFSVKCFPCPLGIPIDKKIVSNDYMIGDTLLTVSRLNFEKNIYTILKAVKILKEKNSIPFSNYVIVGNGPERNKIDNYIKSNNLEDVVILKGFVSNEELRTFYEEAGAVIYLPLDETFGLVYLEAAQYQKPVIGPNHGGPTELIVNKKTGYTVNALQENEVAETIIKLFSDKDKMFKFGLNGRRNLLDNYSFDQFINRFEKFL